MTKKMQIGRVMRTALLGSTVLAVMPAAVGCLDRPVAPATPRTSNTLTDQVRVSAVDKIDLLFMIDNSASMADKQKVLIKAVPDLVDRLINPVCVKPLPGGAVEPQPDKTPNDPAAPCPAGLVREFNAIKDIHIGVVTSSLGAHGADYCVDVDRNDPGQDNRKNFTMNDRGRLISRGPRPEGSTTVNFGADIKTYGDAGFFAWDPDKKKNPPGESNAEALKSNFSQVVLGADQIGCGYEASLEAWYRFLVDPTPPATIKPNPGGIGGTALVEGVDEVLLKQRAEFLRPDSLVAIINLSDENDCSIIDGALPPDVCEDPEFDDNGNPVGCKTARVGWLPGYAEGNFDGWKVEGGRVKGSPFPVNHFASQLRNSGTPFYLNSGTPACADDPYSPDCRQCYTQQASGCAEQNDVTDAANLRCWNQKKRFGVDMLYPLRRYVDGLTQTKVYDRNGFLVQNPLFDDLPHKQARKEGKPLNRAKAEPRNSLLVFYANIVGVPWQDIANDPKDLTKGYKPAYATKEGETGIDWDLILGAPFAVDKKDRKDPKDPLMIESVTARSGTHPITNEPIGPTGWNSINGHEWNPGTSDLQYTCIFDLEAETDCKNATSSCDCGGDDIASQQNPLCETSQGSGQYSSVQYRAKAFPGTRFLQVAKDFGQNAIVASICTPNLKNPSGADFGYRPAVAAIIDRLKTQLAGRCLPRQLAANPDGSTPCLIIDAQFKKDPQNPSPEAEVSACKACDRTARQKIDPKVASLLTGDVLNYECLCEVTQLSGNDLNECQSVQELPLLSSGGDKGGWCYVDPGAVPADKKTAAEAIVEKCPANEKRTIRFVNAKTENTTLFITCLGAASGNESPAAPAASQLAALPAPLPREERGAEGDGARTPG
jgi:hypothetical protein